MNRTGAALLLVAGAGVIAVTLALWGQPLVSASGEIRLWVNSIWSPETSQQVADWYSVSHLVQGMLLALLLRALPLRRPDTVLLWSAFAIGVGWELAEHTDFVLDRFRATTLYQGYLGDTVLNAVMDYVFMLAGVALVRALPVGAALALVAGLELASSLIARDSLTLSTLQVVAPQQAVADWQDAIRPARP